MTLKSQVDYLKRHAPAPLPDDLAELEISARDHLPDFVRVINPHEPPARHHLFMADHLEEIEAGEITRLMIFMPPGFAKSTYASWLFPAWCLGRDPTLHMIEASHTATLATKFSRRVRNILSFPEYRRVFPDTAVATDSKAADRWETTSGGEYRAVGVKGAITGQRADIAIIDDPITGFETADSATQRESIWEWFKADLYTRLKPNASIILIQTRWHEDDLAGRLVEEMEAGGEQWEIVKLPAIAGPNDQLGRTTGEYLWPELFTPENMERIRITQTSRNWSALYQQEPTPEEGAFFKREWIRYYDKQPEHLRFYAASDYAVTADGGDFTVHGVIGVDPNDDIYFVDWWRAQTETEEWIEALLTLARRWEPSQWAEESGQILKSVGPFIRKRMQEESVYFFRDQYTSSADKPARAQSFRGRMQMGKVFLPKNALWTADLVAELLKFPTGKNDDQVDVCGLFGRMLDRMTKGIEPPPPVDLTPRAPTWNEAFQHHVRSQTGERRI